MRNHLLLTCIALGLCTTAALADKPEWAGEGGRPSAEQIEAHRDAMRAKNDDKAGPKGGQDDIDDNQSREEQLRKEKQKQKSKGKSKQAGDDRDPNRDQDKDREQDRARDQHKDKSS